MGVNASKAAKDDAVPEFDIPDIQRHLFTSLGFATTDLNKLHKVFCAMDEGKCCI